MAKNRKFGLKPGKTNTGKLVAAPQGGESGSTQQKKPVFSLEFLRRKYCLSCCDAVEKVAFADRIHELSQLTWAEIAAANRHKQGFEVIAHDSITGDSVPGHITDDTNLLSFRFCGMKPMVGYREGRIFHVLWFDRDFTLYDHG